MCITAYSLGAQKHGQQVQRLAVPFLEALMVLQAYMNAPGMGMGIQTGKSKCKYLRQTAFEASLSLLVVSLLRGPEDKMDEGARRYSNKTDVNIA